MLHLVAFSESLDQGAAASNIAAVPDDTLYAVNDVIRVPTELPNLAGAAFIGNVSTFTSAQLLAPSLRARANYDISGVNVAASPVNPINFDCLAQNPIPLAGDESLTCVTNTDAASAVDLSVIVLLSDGPTQAVTGNQFTVRCTAAVNQADQVWTNGNLTFTQDLPTGDYDVVGLRVEAADGVAARLVFPGGKWRPGVPLVDSASEPGLMKARYGGLGVMGRFNSNNPPSIDVLGGTATAQTVFLDVIRTS